MTNIESFHDAFLNGGTILTGARFLNDIEYLLGTADRALPMCSLYTIQKNVMFSMRNRAIIHIFFMFFADLLANLMHFVSHFGQ